MSKRIGGREHTVEDLDTRSSLFFLVQWYIDYGTEGYDLGALRNVIVVGRRVN